MKVTKTSCILKQSMKFKSTILLILFYCFFLQGNLSQKSKVLDKKQALFCSVMPAREKLPWARCCSPELFVLGSIVVCPGSTAICHCQQLTPYLPLWGGLYGNYCTLGRVGKLEVAVVTGNSFDFFGE